MEVTFLAPGDFDSLLYFIVQQDWTILPPPPPSICQKQMGLGAMPLHWSSIVGLNLWTIHTSVDLSLMIHYRILMAGATLLRKTYGYWTPLCLKNSSAAILY